MPALELIRSFKKLITGRLMSGCIPKEPSKEIIAGGFMRRTALWKQELMMWEWALCFGCMTGVLKSWGLFITAGNWKTGLVLDRIRFHSRGWNPHLTRRTQKNQNTK